MKATGIARRQVREGEVEGSLRPVHATPSQRPRFAPTGAHEPVGKIAAGRRRRVEGLQASGKSPDPPGQGGIVRKFQSFGSEAAQETGRESRRTALLDSFRIAPNETGSQTAPKDNKASPLFPRQAMEHAIHAV